MKRKFIWVVASGLVVVAMLLAACAPAAEKEAAPVAPAVKEAAPAVKEAAPAVKEAAPAAETDMITVTLKKLDGTPVTRTFEKPRYGGVLTKLGADNILSWDETQQAPWSTANYEDMTHEMLLRGDRNRGPAGTNEVSWQMRGWFAIDYEVGLLAESWEFPDNETIIFHLRKGVRWQNRPPVNGRELVADDVVYSLRRIYFDTPTSSMYGMAGEGRPTDVYAKDKYTVVVKTRPNFIYVTLDYVSGWTRIFAPEVEKQYGSQNVDKNGVGTGPFMITEWVPNSSITYVRNPNYWEKDNILGKDSPLPYLDGIKLLTIPDNSTQLAAMRTGKLEQHSTLYWEDVAGLEKTAPWLKNSSFPVCSRMLLGGRQDKDLPFNDIRVRRALMMAINQQEMKNTLYGGNAEILGYPVSGIKEWVRAYTPLEELPLSSDGFDNKKLYTGPYIEEAKKLLAEAGYPNGFKTEVMFTASGTTEARLTAIASYWAKIGVELKLDPKTAAVSDSMYQRKTYTAMHIRSQAVHFPQNMYTVRKDNIYNWGMVTDPKADEYYNRLSVLVPRTNEWWALLKEINLYQVDKVYYITAPAEGQWTVWAPWLKGYYGELDIGPYRTGGGNWLQHAWIDQDLKKSMGY